MRALLLALALLLAAAPAIAATGRTATTAAWWARIVEVPRTDGRHELRVTGRGGGATWSWCGTATVRGEEVALSGAGTASVRVVVEGARLALEVEGVDGVRIDWTGEVTP